MAVVEKQRAGIKPVEDKRFAGILLMLGACFCFTCIDTSAKWLVTNDTPTLVTVFARYAGHFLIALAIIAPTAGVSVFATRNLPLEIVRATMLLASTTFNFLAVGFLPLTVTITIMFATPLVVTALSVPILGEKVGWRRWAAIGVGLVGVLVVMRPGVGDLEPAMFLSVAATLCASLYFILTRKLAGVDASNTLNFYAALVPALGVLPFALAVWSWPTEVIDWVPFLLIGFFGWIGHQMVTVAYRFASAATLAPFFYSQVIYMPISSYFIFGDAPDIYVAIGATIIVGSGLYIWLRERRLEKDGALASKSMGRRPT